jgi:hypothetical protein
VRPDSQHWTSKHIAAQHNKALLVTLHIRFLHTAPRRTPVECHRARPARHVVNFIEHSRSSTQVRWLTVYDRVVGLFGAMKSVIDRATKWFGYSPAERGVQRQLDPRHGKTRKESP